MDSISHYKLLLYGTIARNRIIVASGTYVSNIPVGRKITGMMILTSIIEREQVEEFDLDLTDISDFGFRSAECDHNITGESEEEMIQLSTTYSQNPYPIQLIILDVLQCV
jgi:hypothetical protein